MSIKTKIMETDSVTGALNRTGFFHRVRKVLESNPEQDYAIAYFNIQRFKTVNDLFGYEEGDALLRRAANALAVSFLKPLAVARLEFCCEDFFFCSRKKAFTKFFAVFCS